MTIEFVVFAMYEPCLPAEDHGPYDTEEEAMTKALEIVNQYHLVVVFELHDGHSVCDIEVKPERLTHVSPDNR